MRPLGACRISWSCRGNDARLRRCTGGGAVMSGPLGHKVFVTEQLPQSGRDPLPDGSTRMWSPITSTLIMASREAALVDPPLTVDQAGAVGDWIAASGRELRGIYITH